jgi:putative ABC transport system permease protein
MVSRLHIKLMRDLWRMRSQAVAIAAVAMCGIASFVTMRGAYESLTAAQAAYYAQYQFADVFASFRRAPLSLTEQVRQIGGVARADARIVFEVTLDVQGLEEPATGRLVSLPVAAGQIRQGLNRVHLRQGRMPAVGEHHAILSSEAFAQANKLRPGDSLIAIINGRRETLHITGIAISPEYISEIRGNSFPDNRRFGVMWMNQDALAGLLDMRDGCNDLSLTLAPGASEDEVIRQLDLKLAPYGGTGAIGRADQLSHHFLQNELAQTRVSAIIIPSIFLGVTAFLIHNVLLRLTALQRAQIGLLKSFGYSNAATGIHYLQLALLTVATGGIAGIALGAWLGGGLARLYARFYHFPTLSFSLSPAVMAQAFNLAVLAAVVGAGLAVQRVLRLSPAEAMRPDAPARFRLGWLDKAGLQRALPLPLRMVLRNLARSPVKSGLTILGIALSGSLVVTALFTFDAINEIIRLQFRIAQRDDVTVTFNTVRTLAVTHQLAALPGVLRAEPFLNSAVTLHWQHRKKKTAVVGLPRQRQLRLTLDAAERSTELPAQGIVLTKVLADSLQVHAGDHISMAFTEGRRLLVSVPIVMIVEEPIGSFAYMDLTALAQLLQQDITVSGAYLSVDRLQQTQLYRALKSVPAIASVSLREATVQSFLATVGENIRINNTVLILFACVIASGVIYNAARIALSEHAIELASLRILGFSQREVAQLLLAEQAILTGIAIPLGCAIGYVLAALIATLLSQELFRIPLIVSDRTFLVAALVIVLAASGSASLVWLRLRKLNLIEVLKTRE